MTTERNILYRSHICARLGISPTEPCAGGSKRGFSRPRGRGAGVPAAARFGPPPRSRSGSGASGGPLRGPPEPEIESPRQHPLARAGTGIRAGAGETNWLSRPQF